ncbi:MAG: LptF/LptG family permease [Candidatus Sumerlaeia bacterium]|nr:LptF/LptG family permease [Candidatus Sumerlaeia bacterium]
MTTLRLYILRELFLPVLISICFFTFVLLLVSLVEDAQKLLTAGISGQMLGQLVVILLGTLLTFTVPMGVLLGTLIAVGRLTNENEILAIRVAGISPPRVFVPALVFALGLSGLHMAANNTALPALFGQVREITYQMQFQLLTNLRPDRVYDDIGTSGTTMALTYEKRDEEIDTDAGLARLRMRGVNMRLKVERDEVFPSEAPVARSGEAFEFLLFAETGTITGDPESGDLTLELYDGTWMPMPRNEPPADPPVEQAVAEGDVTIEPPDESTTVIRFETLRNRMGSKKIDRATSMMPREMPLRQLLDHIADPPHHVPVFREIERRGTVTRRITGAWEAYFEARNELITRFTLPLATFTFALIAIPLAMEIRPRAKSLSALLAAGLLLAYYMLMTFGNAVGAGGASWPVTVLVHLLPNLLIGGVGIVLLIREARR